MKYGIVLALLLLLDGQFTIPFRTGATAVNGPPPLNPCLVSAWPMNEGSGLTLHDTSTGGTNTATISAAPAVTWQSNAGFPGTTPLWSGSGSALATSTTLTNFDGTTPFSVSAWIKVSALGTQETFMSTLNSTGTFQGWELSKQGTSGPSTDAPQFFLLNNFPSNAIQFLGGTPMTTGLNFVVATYDGSRTISGVNLYLNGVSLTFASGSISNLSATTANGLPVRFGVRNNGSVPLIGAMAFAEVYNCVLTPTQVTTYNAAGPGIY